MTTPDLPLVAPLGSEWLLRPLPPSPPGWALWLLDLARPLLELLGG